MIIKISLPDKAWNYYTIYNSIKELVIEMKKYKYLELICENSNIDLPIISSPLNDGPCSATIPWGGIYDFTAIDKDKLSSEIWAIIFEAEFKDSL